MSDYTITHNKKDRFCYFNLTCRIEYTVSLPCVDGIRLNWSSCKKAPSKHVLGNFFKIIASVGALLMSALTPFYED